MNVTQIKSGISILIFCLPSEICSELQCLSFPPPIPHPPPSPSVSHCCFILFLPVIHHPVALFSLSELLIQAHTTTAAATTASSVAIKRQCEWSFYPNFWILSNRCCSLLATEIRLLQYEHLEMEVQVG